MSPRQAHARFENHTRGRFLEIAREGTLLKRWFGRLGASTGHYREEILEDSPLAETAYRQQVRRILRKGYWQGHHDPRFVAQIAAAPDEVGRYLVYADWLEEQGDPRAAWIRAHHRGDRAAIAKLAEDHRDSLIPRVSDESVRVKLSWWMGFARVLRVSFPFDWRPVPRVVLRHPSSQLVRALVIRPHHHYPRMTPDCPVGLDAELARTPTLEGVWIPVGYPPWPDTLGGAPVHRGDPNDTDARAGRG